MITSFSLTETFLAFFPFIVTSSAATAVKGLSKDNVHSSARAETVLLPVYLGFTSQPFTIMSPAYTFLPVYALPGLKAS